MNLIFFDIDGTLLISKGAGGRSIVRVMKSTFQVKDKIARIEIHGQTDRGIATQLFQSHAIDDNEDNWVRFTTGYLEILDDELEKSDGSLLPGIPDLLGVLRQEEHVEMALLTGNIEQGARKKVAHFGIDEFFTWGGFGDNHRDRSEMARNAMQVAQQQLNLEQVENIFVIGDTPNDIRCGKAISATTIAVATAGFSRQELEAHSPDFVFDDLSDLDQIVPVLT